MELPRRTIGSRMEKHVRVQGTTVAALIIFFGILPTCAYVLPTNGIERPTEENSGALNGTPFDQELATGDTLESSPSKPDLEWDTDASVKTEDAGKDFPGDKFRAEEGKDSRVIKTRSVRSEPGAAGVNKNPNKALASRETKLKSEKLSRKNTKKETMISRKTSEKLIDGHEKKNPKEEKGAKKSEVMAPGGYLTLEERISAWLLAKRKADTDWEDAAPETDFPDTRSRPVSDDDDSGVLVHIDKMKNYDVNDDTYGDDGLVAPRGYGDPGDFMGQPHGYHYPSGYNRDVELRRYGMSDDTDQYKDFLEVQKSKRGKNYEKTFEKDQGEYDNVGPNRNIKTNDKPMFFYYYDPESHYAPSGVKSQFQFYDKEYGVDDPFMYEENEDREGKGKRDISPKGSKDPRELNANVNSFYTLENYVDEDPSFNKRSSAETINTSHLGSLKDTGMDKGLRSSKENKKNKAPVDGDVSGDRLGKTKNKDRRDLTEYVKKSSKIVNRVAVKEESKESRPNVPPNSNLENVKTVGDAVDVEAERLLGKAKQFEVSANSQEMVHKNQGAPLQAEAINIGAIMQRGDNSGNTSDISASNATSGTGEDKTEKRSSLEEKVTVKSKEIDQSNITSQNKDLVADVPIQKSTGAVTSKHQNASVSPITSQDEKDDASRTLEKSSRDVPSSIENGTDIPSGGTSLIFTSNDTTISDQNEETIPILRHDTTISDQNKETIPILRNDTTISEQNEETMPILRNVATKISVLTKNVIPPKSLNNFSVVTLPSVEQGQEIFTETSKLDSKSIDGLLSKIENNGSDSPSTIRLKDATLTNMAELSDVGSNLSLSSGSLNVLSANSSNLDNPNDGTKTNITTTNSSLKSEDLTIADFSHKNITSVELSSSFDGVGVTAVHDFTDTSSTFQDNVKMDLPASVTNDTRNSIRDNTEANRTNETFENSNGSVSHETNESTTRDDVKSAESEKIPTAYMASVVLSSSDHVSALNKPGNVSGDSINKKENGLSTADTNETSTTNKEELIQSNKVLISSDVGNSKSNVSLQITDSHLASNGSDRSFKKNDNTSPQEVMSNNETRLNSGRSDKEHIQMSLAEIAPQDNGEEVFGSLGNMSTSKLPADPMSVSRDLNGSVESLSEKSLLQHNTTPLPIVPSGNGSKVSDHPLESDDVQRSTEDLSLKVMGVHAAPETAKVSTANPNVTLQYAGNNTWVFKDTATAESVTESGNDTQAAQSSSGHDNNSSVTINSAASQSQSSSLSTEDVKEQQKKHLSIGPVIEIRNASYSLNMVHSNTSLLNNSNAEGQNILGTVGNSSHFTSNSNNSTFEQEVLSDEQRNITGESNTTSTLNPQEKILTTTFLSDSNFSRKLLSIADVQFSGYTDLNETRNASREVDSRNTTRRFIVSSEDNTTYPASHDTPRSTLYTNITTDQQVNGNSTTKQEDARFNDTLKSSMGRSLNQTLQDSETTSPAGNHSLVEKKNTSSVVPEVMKNVVIPSSKKLQTHEPQLQDGGDAAKRILVSNLVNGSSHPNQGHRLDNNTSATNDLQSNNLRENATQVEDDSISVENFLKSQSVNSHNLTTMPVFATAGGVAIDSVTNSSSEAMAVNLTYSNDGMTVNLTDSKDVQKSSVTRREILTSSSQYVSAAASGGRDNSSVSNVTSWLSEISQKNGGEQENNISGQSDKNRTNFETTMNPGANNLKTRNESFQITSVGDGTKEPHVRDIERLVPVGAHTFKSSAFDGLNASTNGSLANVTISSNDADLKIDAGRGSDVTAGDPSHFSAPSAEESDIAVPPISAYMIQDFSLRKPNPDTKSTSVDSKNTKSGGDAVSSGSSINVDSTMGGGRANSTGGTPSNSTDLPCVGPACDFGPLSVPPRSQAAVSAVLTTHFGPTKDTMIPFDLELLDLDDNYDNTTGMFICTIPGTYVISLYLMSHPGAKVNARVFINNRPIAALWADDSKNAGFYPSSSTQTIAQLGFGDQVYVMLVDGGYGESWVHANYNVFTIFLLYEQVF
ncbi:unnamed protein product [Lymnaea stagnalis]|uniref:C1q domain-containing protein n=1 Tax=Lymnaea stagnalis TaxID=6523 RepID=A0AAV2HQE2_LYMST